MAITGVILVGGRGVRLRPLTLTRPKALLPICNRPLIEYVIENLKRCGITNLLVIADRYNEDSIKNYLGNGSKFNVKINYLERASPVSTVDAIRNAEEFLTDDFLVVMGDNLTNVDIRKVINYHYEKNSIATIGLKYMEKPLSYGVVVLNPEKRIVFFKKRPVSEDIKIPFDQLSTTAKFEIYTSLENTQIYFFDQGIISLLKERITFHSFGANVFPYLAKHEYPVYAYIFDQEEYWMGIDYPQRYLWAHWDVLRRWAWPFLPEGKLSLGSWYGENITMGENVKIESPSQISDNVTIGDSTTIKSLSTIGRNVSIGSNCEISGSVILDNVKIGNNVKIHNAIIDKGATIEDNVVIEGIAVVGANAKIGKNVVIRPKAYVWPNMVVPEGYEVIKSFK